MWGHRRVSQPHINPTDHREKAGNGGNSRERKSLLLTGRLGKTPAQLTGPQRFRKPVLYPLSYEGVGMEGTGAGGVLNRIRTPVCCVADPV